MKTHELIEAITHRQVLSILYGGGWRLIEPHTFGRLQNGKEMLRAYQIGGFSESGEPVGWKLFDVRKIISCKLSGGGFSSPRPGYNPRDSIMRGGIIATF
jgi:hypothetical protein